MIHRQVRRVPAGWQHPRNPDGTYIPLFDGATFIIRCLNWDRDAAAWNRGEFPDYADQESRRMSFAEWDGERPDPADYTPIWTEAEGTHLMMYECTTEGTPVSPAFATAEELARWLTDNGISVYGNAVTTYDHWLFMINGPQLLQSLSDHLTSTFENIASAMAVPPEIMASTPALEPVYSGPPLRDYQIALIEAMKKQHLIRMDMPAKVTIVVTDEASIPVKKDVP